MFSQIISNLTVVGIPCKKDVSLKNECSIECMIFVDLEPSTTSHQMSGTCEKCVESDKTAQSPAPAELRNEIISQKGMLSRRERVCV